MQKLFSCQFIFLQPLQYLYSFSRLAILLMGCCFVILALKGYKVEVFPVFVLVFVMGILVFFWFFTATL